VINSADSFNTFLTLQQNGQPFDTTGADLLIAGLAGVNLDIFLGQNAFRDTLSGVPTANTWQRVFIPSLAISGVQANILFSLPTETGPNAGFRFVSGSANYTPVSAIALKGAKQAGPSTFSSNVSAGATGTGLAASLNVNARAIIVSVFGNATVQAGAVTPPVGYQSVGVGLINTISYGVFLGWNIGEFTTGQNTIWFQPTAQLMLVGGASFLAQDQSQFP
jgi:hypothetical protein